mmetsp:Transcript_53450/g.159951  ORF Transcript_53450/g.159951 Transcript_53450/m.159951 type:complete len:497 (-) Transcript_53450:146-1636(-)
MLCGCLEPLVSSAPGNHGGGMGGSYPGRRQDGPFVPTGGNAVAAFDPNTHGNASGPMGQMVAVTVPPGIFPGQSLQVASPDGSGRLVQAVVPAGAVPGSTFMVQFPPNTTVPQPHAIAKPCGMEPPQPIFQQPLAASAGVATAGTELPTATAVPVPPVGKESASPMAYHGNYNDVAVLQPPDTTPPSSSSAPSPPPGEKLIMVEVPPGTFPGTPLHVQVPGENRTIMATVPPGNIKQFHVSYKPSTPQPSNQATQQQPPGEKLIMVQVPPGTSPGTPLHVQVPGENRTIMATVPPGNVKQFHVSYKPLTRSQPSNQAIQQSAGNPAASSPVVPAAPPGQKLILVNVPPGTAPGATLHVQVPGENRVLAANVPHGNVKAFHVAYTPQQQLGGMPTGQPMRQEQQHMPQAGYGDGYGRNAHNSTTGNSNQGGGGIMGSVAPVVAGAAGAALMGAAAYSVFHHGSSGAEQGGENVQYANETDDVMDDDGDDADFDVADY